MIETVVLENVSAGDLDGAGAGEVTGGCDAVGGCVGDGDVGDLLHAASSTAAIVTGTTQK